MGYVSNATGTVHDIATITRWAHDVGALVFVDAVQFVPRRPVGVQALGCDLLACSAYNFHRSLAVGEDIDKALWFCDQRKSQSHTAASTQGAR